MVVESPVSLTFSTRELPISHTPLLVVNNAGSSTTPPPPPRQPVVRHLSAPLESLHSPLRHHRRTASVGRPPIRETLNASLSYEDEDGIRVNQYNLLPHLLPCSSPYLTFAKVSHQTRDWKRFLRCCSLGSGSNWSKICIVAKTPSACFLG